VIIHQASVDSSLSLLDDDRVDPPVILEMSPLATSPPAIFSRPPRASLTLKTTNPPTPHRHLNSLTGAVGDLNLNEVAFWSPRQVAMWMQDAGFEPSIVEKFEENDISGAILITLKFEDLRELDIQSFGQRTKVWNEIHILRGSEPGTPKPAVITPIEESSPCVEVRKEPTRRGRNLDCNSDEDQVQPRRRKHSNRRHHTLDTVTPLDSVSIVGIEQLVPKPHRCAKGENCSKWRKQQRLIDSFNKEHPVSPDGGRILIAGDPGNPLTAEASRPFSDTIPSMVASSDVLGPGTIPAFRHLEEASLRNVESRDPQENVKQFLRFQHIDTSLLHSSEDPVTPPYEMFPPLQGGISGLRDLPRLSIPAGTRPDPVARSASVNDIGNTFSPYRMERAEAMSPELRNATYSPSLYRLGSPFSEMDVPLTAIPLGPVARDTSQSVPPNMNYRHPATPAVRTQSRNAVRRPSIAPMPPLHENRPSQQMRAPASIHSKQSSTSSSFQSREPPQGPGILDQWSTEALPIPGPNDPSYAGWMKKRKTKMLRHEWHEHHFTLKGTRLAMYNDSKALDTLEYIDVDDYAIACSSLASSSKLNAAFKAINISRGKEKEKRDETMFAFQLIPAPTEKGSKLKKRESEMWGSKEGGGTGKEEEAKKKTHHFAVTSRDQRIDWMRELMLAKALKQKSQG